MMRGDEIDGLSPRIAREMVRSHESSERRQDLRAAMIIQGLTGAKPWECFDSLEYLRPMPRTPDELENKIRAAFGL